MSKVLRPVCWLVVVVCSDGVKADVVLENPRLRAVLGEDAIWQSLADKVTGKDYCATKSRTCIATVRIAGKTYNANHASLADDRLTLGFAGWARRKRAA